MPERNLIYFVSDVHLGLDVKDPADRERRFVAFLRSLDPQRTKALYMLGDIWDFWYEYHDVAPMGYVRVFSAILDLIEAGVKVYFFRGNHDIWIYHYFSRLGMEILEQPYVLEAGGKRFCLGHGDGLGPGMYSYKLMRWVFRARFFQVLYSFLHPWLAFRLGKGWSKKSRLAKSVEYVFRGEDEPLYKWCADFCAETPVDYFIFGHYHTRVDMPVAGGARLLILKDWMDSSPYVSFDLTTGVLGYCPNMEK